MAITTPSGFSSVAKGIFPVTIDIASIPAVETLVVTATVPCSTGDIGILVPPADLDMGLLWTTGWCADAGTMSFRFGNVTAGAINEASGTFYIMVI